MRVHATVCLLSVILACGDAPKSAASASAVVAAEPSATAPSASVAPTLSTPSSAPSSSALPAPIDITTFDWAKFPAKMTYTMRVEGPGDTSSRAAVVETTVDRPAGPNTRRLGVNLTFDFGKGKKSTSSSELVLDERGLAYLSEKQAEGELRHDPPFVVVPALPENGKRWKSTLPDGTELDVEIAAGSPYCDGGFRVVRLGAPTRAATSRTTDHFCPGEGWRGKDRYDKTGNLQTWTWTEGVVADGKKREDPPVAKRFPEALPPIVSPFSEP